MPTSTGPDNTLSRGKQLLSWMRSNSELGWMPDRMLRPLARAIEREPHFERMFDMVRDMRAGITPDKADYMQLAIDIASESRLKAPKDGLVLFSGSEEARAREDVLANDKLFTNHRLPATAMLELMETFGKDTTPLTEKEERYLPWQILSVRLVQEAKGNVHIYVKDPAPDRTFRKFELDPLIANTDVTSLNGQPKENWAPLITGKPNMGQMMDQGRAMIETARATADAGPAPANDRSFQPGMTAAA